MRISRIKALQDLCIDCIVKSFDQIISTYKSRRNRCGNRMGYEFLQRKYSNLILGRLDLSTHSSKGEEWLTFLINKHVRELHLERKLAPFQTVILGRLAFIGETLVHLTLTKSDDKRPSSRKYRKTTIMQLVRMIPNIEELNLCDTSSCDDVLKNIARHCSRLRILNMDYTKVTNDGICYLYTNTESGVIKTNTTLTELYIRFTGVTEDAVVCLLKNIPNLTVLEHTHLLESLCKCYLAHEASGSKDKMPVYNIQQIDCFMFEPIIIKIPGHIRQSYSQKDVLRICSMLCPQLNMFTCQMFMKSSSLEACCQFKQLKHLCVECREANYSPFIKLQGHLLETLDLSYGSLSLEVLVECCQNLVTLKLGYTNFIQHPSKANSHNYNLTKLSDLTLESCDQGSDNKDFIVYLMNSCPNLNDLSFRHFKFDDRSFITLVLTSVCMQSLQKLELYLTDLTLAPAYKFHLSAPNLEEIIIQNNHTRYFNVGMCNTSDDSD